MTKKPYAKLLVRSVCGEMLVKFQILVFYLPHLHLLINTYLISIFYTWFEAISCIQAIGTETNNSYEGISQLSLPPFKITFDAECSFILLALGVFFSPSCWNCRECLVLSFIFVRGNEFSRTARFCCYAVLLLQAALLALNVLLKFFCHEGWSFCV